MSRAVGEKLLRITSQSLAAPSPQVLEKVQSQWPRLPPDYWRFLQQFGGAPIFPETAIFEAKGYGAIDIDVFLSAQGVLDVALQYRDRIDPALMPIAKSSGGDVICISSDGAVFFWDHEREGQPTASVQIGHTFSEFFLSLREQPSSEDVSSDDVVVELDPSLLAGDPTQDKPRK